MIEEQVINNKQVWIKINPVLNERMDPNIIPVEYFTASYYTHQPEEKEVGEIIRDEEHHPKLFESPVAAITFTAKKLETIL